MGYILILLAAFVYAIQYLSMRHEIFTAVKISIEVFWNMTTRSSVRIRLHVVLGDVMVSVLINGLNVRELKSGRGR
jgi:hypothetical protein